MIMKNLIKIMYVDDEPLNRLLFHKLIDKENIEVFLAHDGIEALKLLNNNPGINLIFSDMQMPIMDGIEFIQKAREKYPDKKYVLLTCMEKTPPIQQALDSMIICKFLRKPVSHKVIIDTINETIHKEKLIM